MARRRELAGARVNDRNPFRSARRVRQDFGMISLGSSGSDCPMGMSFREKGVNPSYTLERSEKSVVTMILYYL